MKIIYLILAILFEVIGTTMMKLSEGFTKPLFSMAIFMSYIGSLTFLTLTLKYLEISIVYAVWSGVGIAVISIIGITYFGERLDILKFVSLLLVVLGIVGLNMSGR